MSGIFGGKTIHNEETQIAGFQVNSATYGVSTPLILGTTRISGNVIDWFDFTAVPHTETQRAGKGGGSKIKTTTYTYTVAAVIGLCEGPVKGVGRIWKDKEVYVTPEAYNQANTEQHNNVSTGKDRIWNILRGSKTYGLTLFKGEYGQAPWAYTQSRYPEKALPYSGLAYMAGVVDLGSSGGLPQLNFEVSSLLTETGDGLDVNPASAIEYIVMDEKNGVGFGTGSIDAAGLERLRKFCQASDLLLTLPLTDTRKAYEIIQDICKATNTINFWSQNRLKLVPQCDERLVKDNVVFEPDVVPLYDLNADDFLEMQDGRLVVFEREDNAESYNHVTVEFINRENAYEVETAEYKIQVDINRRGLRSMPTVELHYIHSKERAEYVASLLAMDSLYGRTKYRFRLGWSHCLLEPGDIVTLTETTNGLKKKPVVITQIEEDDEGMLEVEAKGKPPGIYSPGRYTAHQADRASIDYNADPGPVNTPVFFELPYILTDGKMAVMVAVAGNSSLWGGCSVWVSTDDESYQYAGEVNAPSRYGVLSKALAAGGTTDTANILSVDVSRSGKALLSGTQDDAKTMKTLCWADGELIAYQTATLTGENAYDLSYLVRGCYGTEIKSHASNSNFVRVDRDVLFSYEYLPQDIGRTVYIKLTSNNVFGTKEQSLEEVSAYAYVIQGKLPDGGAEFIVTQSETKLIATLKNNYSSTDYLEFFTYELRMGPTWEKSILIDRFNGDKYSFDAPNEGTLTFWLKVVDQAGNYSQSATRAIVNVVNLPARNIIFEREENLDSWETINMWRDTAGRYRIKALQSLGEYEYFIDMFGQEPFLRIGAEVIFPVIDLGPNILDESCYYVDVTGTMRLRYAEKLGDFIRFIDMFGAELTPVKPEYAKETFVGLTVKHTASGQARVDVEYRTSLDGIQWGAWIPGAIKQFTGRYVQIKLLPVSLDGTGQVYITGATVKIDVPDIEEIIESVTIAAARTRILFKCKFAEVKSIAPYTQDAAGKQATCYIAEQTNEYADIEIWDESGNLISGKLQSMRIRGY